MKPFIYPWIFGLCALIASCTRQPVDPLGQMPEFRVLLYAGLMGQDGLEPVLQEEWKRLGLGRLKLIAVSDPFQLVQRLLAEVRTGNPQVHAVLGLDYVTLGQIAPIADDRAEILAACRFLVADLPCEKGFIPTDFGALAWVTRVKDLGTSVTAAQIGKLGRISIPDPRTSSTGFGLVSASETWFTQNEDYARLWKSLRGQWIALSPTWEAAYGLFVRSEVESTWSYVTSEAYHREHGEDAYHAVLSAEGSPVQIEGTIVVRGPFGAEVKKLQAQWAQMVVSPEVQNQIAKRVWMFPSRKEVILPESFKKLPVVTKKFFLQSRSPEAMQSSLAKWRKALAQ